MASYPVTLEEYLATKNANPKYRHMIEALLRSLNLHRYAKKTVEQWDAELNALLDAPA